MLNNYNYRYTIILLIILIVTFSGCLGGGGQTETNSSVDQSNNTSSEQNISDKNNDKKLEDKKEDKAKNKEDKKSIDKKEINSILESERYDYKRSELVNISSSRIDELDRRLDIPVQCKLKEEDYKFEGKYWRRMQGERLNLYKIENMVHKDLNEIRKRGQTFFKPLKCSNRLQEIARENSRRIIREEQLEKGALKREERRKELIKERTGKICKSSKVSVGKFYYRHDLNNDQFERNKETNQKSKKIDSHRELAIDFRSSYGTDSFDIIYTNGTIDLKSYKSVKSTRTKLHGVGFAKEEETNWVVATYIICS